MIDIEEKFLSFSEENDLNSMKEYIKKYNISQRTLDCALANACELGFSLIVEFLINNTTVNPAFDNSFNLQMACEYGHTEIVLLLLKDGRVCPYAEDNTPIKNAAKYDTNAHYFIIQKLIEADENVNYTYNNNELFQKVLFRESDHDNRLLYFLWEKKDTIISNYNFIFRLTQSSNSYLVKDLIQDYKIDINHPHFCNNIFCHFIQNGHNSLAQLMLDEYMLSIEEEYITERPSGFLCLLEYRQVDMINQYLRFFKENNKKYSSCYRINNAIIDLAGYKEFKSIVKEITNYFKFEIEKEKEELFLKKLLMQNDLEFFNFFVNKLNIDLKKYKEEIIISILTNKNYFFIFYESFKIYETDIFPLIVEHVEEDCIIEYFLKDKNLSSKIKNNEVLSKTFEKVILKNNVEAF